MKNKKIIAIIPARGGSKGIPKKNIKTLDGKPLIYYTIRAVLKSKFLDEAIVSTDDEKIAKIARRYGANVPFLRPEEFAKDKSPNSVVIEHTLGWFKERGKNFDIVAWLEPTSPLRKDTDIDNAIRLFLKDYNKADSLVSVGEVHMENPYITKIIKKGYVSPLIKIKKNIYQRQQLPKVYFPYGIIYLSKINTYRKQGTFYQKRNIPYFIERWQNYEIDDIYDFVAVEAIIKKINKEK